uniref:C2H2-type domain-containing protein n=1 Tax=Anopheles farauti TaxID=69004 RepID=A0A182QLY5_9DIPT
MALNTPKRLKTAVPPGAENYLTTPPPVDFRSTQSFGTPTSSSDQSHNGYSQAPQPLGTWNNSWLSDATSPTSSCSSPDGHQNRSYGGHNSSGTPQTTWHGGGGSAEKSSENKRGRPRSEALTTLMVEGSISPSAIKCRYCNRVFPREKSLQAHLRTHTGERPYQCDYPGCNRAFTQSGQLKTHQRLHTGERPFICSVAQCQMRFTHANRHCPDHPYETLKRCDDFVIQTVPDQNGEVQKWIEKYRAGREDRTPTRKTPKRSNASNGVGGHDGGDGGGCGGTANGALMHGQNDNANRRPLTAGISNNTKNNENHLPEGLNGGVNGAVGAGMGGDSVTGAGLVAANVLPSSPVTPNNPYKLSRKGLMDMNAAMGGNPGLSPVTSKSKNSRPKLMQWQEPTSQEEDESGDECYAPSPKSTFNPKKKWLRDAWQDDLAKPLEPNVISQKVFSSTTSTMALKQQLHQEIVSATISPAKRQLLGVTGHSKPLPRMEGFCAASTPVDPNQTRPTVLMVASKDCARPLSELLTAANGGNSPKCGSPRPEENNRKLQGALALMQLAAKDALLAEVPFGSVTNVKEETQRPTLAPSGVPSATEANGALLERYG